MSGLSIAKSIGHHGHWGFSAPFDFLEAIGGKSGVSTVNILLIQPGDIRHIISALVRRRRHRKNSLEPLRPINIYVLEPQHEILARELLLFHIFSDFEIPIRQRGNIFLEVFGNCKVQRRTAKYIEQLGYDMKCLIANNTGRLQNNINFELLKYRDKDELEAVFRSYYEDSPFDMTLLHDRRLRSLYEERFDGRKAIYDWDYCSHLKEKASIIHIKQFKDWRHTGIAFEFGDQQYTETNRTLLTFTEGVMKVGKDKGLKKEIKGFWGDVACGPYYSFGIDCETASKHAEGLFDIYNKNTGTEQHRHHSVEIALFNMFCALWELETASRYAMTKANDIFSGLGQDSKSLKSKVDFLEDEVGDGVEKQKTEVEKLEKKEADDEPRVVELEDGEEQEGEALKKKEDTEEAAAKPAAPVAEDGTKDASAAGVTEAEIMKAIQRAECIAEAYENFQVIPVIGNIAQLNKDKFLGHFDGIFVSSRASQCIAEPFFNSLLKENGLLAAETAKFVLPLSSRNQNDFQAKLEEFATSKAGLKKIPAPVPRRYRDEKDKVDDVLFFRKTTL